MAEVVKVLDPKMIAWVEAGKTPQPTGVSVQSYRACRRDKVRRTTNNRTPPFASPRFDGCLAAAKPDPSWAPCVLEPDVAGHDAILNAPARGALIHAEAA